METQKIRIDSFESWEKGEGGKWVGRFNLVSEGGASEHAKKGMSQIFLTASDIMDSAAKEDSPWDVYELEILGDACRAHPEIGEAMRRVL